jgi:hypothetical protein
MISGARNENLKNFIHFFSLEQMTDSVNATAHLEYYGTLYLLGAIVFRMFKYYTFCATSNTPYLSIKYFFFSIASQTSVTSYQCGGTPPKMNRRILQITNNINIQTFSGLAFPYLQAF